MSDEIERRKKVVADRATDLDRWSKRESFSPQWAYRARLAAQLIPAYARVLDIGAGAMDLEKVLPAGCEYQPCDLVKRDERTLVCDLNAGEFPHDAEADVVTMLGVLEYLTEPLAVLRKVRALNRPFVCSYSVGERSRHMDRATQGWINDFDSAGLETLMNEAGFRLERREPVDRLQDLFKWMPDDGAPRRPAAARLKKVLVLSYYNDRNFGDRLGYHVINGLIPPDAIVTHAAINPWTVPDEQFDLFILGIGNSLNGPPIARPELMRLIKATPHTLGVFGTQYRRQYRELIDFQLFDDLLSNLTTWWARYEEDIQAFGRGRSNVRHLGDFLVSAFPMATPTLDRTLEIPANLVSHAALLDRIIQQIQSYRRVASARLHPLLCALTSAEEVKYLEQREFADWGESGKFRSLLYDVFGRTYDEGAFFSVDREAVVRYKLRVDANMAELKAQIASLLA